MEKEAVRQRNLEQRQMEENKARHMKHMILAQKQQAAQQRELNLIDRQNRTR